MTSDRFKEAFAIIKEHQKWIEYNKNPLLPYQGQRADLSKMILDGINFESGCGIYRVSLEDARLEEADLRNANLDEVSFDQANLKNANFENASFRYSWCRSTCFQGSNLKNANLHASNFQNAILCGANLEGVNFKFVTLEGADLRGAKLDHGILKCENLTYTKWLKTDIPWFIQHKDYSEWGDTIQILDE